MSFCTILASYDLYWSVQPPIILALILLFLSKDEPGSILLVLAVFFGTRLSINEMMTFPGLHQQDWRYDQLKQQSGWFFPRVNLVCKALKHITIQRRNIFIGEVVQSYVREDCLVQKGEHRKLADLTVLDPLIYALDNRYDRIGQPIGTGYQESKKISRLG